tara:strand:+ start:607 stop:1290 length:684 start_codon:yes stop_codon:yes gene_type:complete
MESLNELMEIVDSQSDVLTEGIYIKMCNCLKKVHDFLVSPMEQDSNSDDEFQIQEIPSVEETAEIIANIDLVEIKIMGIVEDLQIVERSLRKLKPINRITKKVKEAAIEEVCSSDRRMVGGKAWTFANLVAHSSYTLNPNPPGAVERKIYQDYKERTNERINRLIGEAQYHKMDLECEKERYVEHHNELTQRLPIGSGRIEEAMLFLRGPVYDWDRVRARPVNFLSG